MAISGGEVKRPYVTMPLGPTTNFAQVVGGPPGQDGNPTASGYEGSLTGPCNELSGTRAIANASFTKGEADGLMKMLCIADPKKFHLDDSTSEPGHYCIYYKDAGKAREWIGELDCNAIGDGFWAEANGWLNPFAEYTRCQEIMQALDEGYEPKAVRVIKWFGLTLFGLSSLAVTGTVAGYTFFKGGDMYQTRKAARTEARAAKEAEKKDGPDDKGGPKDGDATGGGDGVAIRTGAPPVQQLLRSASVEIFLRQAATAPLPSIPRMAAPRAALAGRMGGALNVVGLGLQLLFFAVENYGVDRHGNPTLDENSSAWDKFLEFFGAMGQGIEMFMFGPQPGDPGYIYSRGNLDA
jgi:hypothetical protein